MFLPTQLGDEALEQMAASKATPNLAIKISFFK